MLEQKVLETIKEYNLIKSGDTILIGVSGGPDSICLLNILNNLKEKLNFKIIVAHINHMIRKEAEEETIYVQNFCSYINVKCFVKRIDVVKIAKNNKQGTEETGRNIRYDFFEEVAKNNGAKRIATAHNNNDKVETIIMNILRGSGAGGLKGIEAKRGDKFIRPLINCSRNEIEEYCNINNLKPKYDKSNNECIYTRNKIRNIVIPYVQKEFNSNFIKTINRLSEIIAEEQSYLNKITEQEYNQIKDDNSKNEIVLDLKRFNNIDLVVKRRLILYTINELLGTTNGIEKINIDDIIKLCSNNIGNKYLMPTTKLEILIKNNKIFFISNIDVP